jgi:hypothetical protein
MKLPNKNKVKVYMRLITLLGKESMRKKIAPLKAILKS